MLVLVGLLLAFGGLGALLEDDRTPTTSETAPADVPPTRSPPRTPTPSEPRDAPAQPTTKPPTTRPPGVVVLRVIDGDTIDVRGDGRIVPKDTVTRVRLLEIDTPERGACFADTATARTSALLPAGSSARAERDVELTDRYDRYLLYVWNDQGVFVNESLVRSGHATAVLFPPNDKHWPGISRAEDAARQAGAGLWTACTDTPEPAPPDTPTRPNLPEGPPAGVPDVDCADLPGPVWVGPDDPHRLDRDGDGIGCDTG
ncbi:thermonuclease family protein [Streptomyces sp. NBC_00258]|uniref:thermonuclease family protein n=1 Tax=Streptomyces sp. NBC_00258 TaxID=2903642 RepID=UPI002E2A76DD|nr:thermonuclease family protein [Streptomyces sp. NBC_00258]